jgi:hypothetical protein
MRVMCLQRLPVLVRPLHWVVAVPVPCGFDDTKFSGAMRAGLQILQACNPSSVASEIEIASDTFLLCGRLLCDTLHQTVSYKLFVLLEK